MKENKLEKEKAEEKDPLMEMMMEILKTAPKAMATERNRIHTPVGTKS